MKRVIRPADLKDIPAFSPPHHTGTLDRKLVCEDNGAQHLAVWYGEMDTGGEAEEHVHPDVEQAFYVLEGDAIFTLGPEEHRLRAGGLIFVPVQTPHRITSVGEQGLKMLIIMAPPATSADAWQK